MMLECVGSALRLFLVEVAKEALASVKKVAVVVNTADDVAIGKEGDVTNAVRVHLAAVAGSGLEGLELVAVIPAETVPSGEPKETVAVLKQLCHMTVGKAVVFVVVMQIADGLTDYRATDSKEQQERQQCFSYHLPLYYDIK